MKDLFKRIRWYYVVIAFGIIGLFSFKASNSNYFEISKNLDIFATLFREVNTYYVDDVDAGKMIKNAID